MNWFKRLIGYKEPVPLSERPATKCGDENKEQHYKWLDIHWPCPACIALHEYEREKRQEDYTAEKIAAAVALKLKGR